MSVIHQKIHKIKWLNRINVKLRMSYPWRVGELRYSVVDVVFSVGEIRLDGGDGRLLLGGLTSGFTN